MKERIGRVFIKTCPPAWYLSNYSLHLQAYTANYADASELHHLFMTPTLVTLQKMLMQQYSEDKLSTL